MDSTSEPEKKNFEEQKVFLPNEDRPFYEAIKKLNDRELQEKQAFYLRNIQNSNERIKLNLQFWFYFAIASMVISFLILIN